MPHPVYCKFSNEDLELAATACRTYRRRHRLTRAQLAVLLDTLPYRIADLEHGRDPRLDRLIEAIFDLTNADPDIEPDED